MCQKQVNTLMKMGVSVEISDNKTLLICQKGDLVTEYSVNRDCWFIRGDNKKYYTFHEMVKYFSQPKPQENAAINSQGLTVRDYFAAKALQGLVADAVIDAPKIARMAYELADAMMKERVS